MNPSIARPVAQAIRAPLVARRVLIRTGIFLVLIANAVLFIVALQGLLFGPAPPDWLGQVDAANRISSGIDPYVGQTYGFRWSPLAAWVLVPVVAAGLQVWQLLHIAALALLPRKAILVSLACFAFWVDLAMGNVVTFGFVLAYLALSGRRSGVLAFTVFALLVPRPLYIPLLLWLWLQNPEQRRWMTAVGLVLGVLTLATGYAQSWMEVLVRSPHDIVNASNMAPSQFIGYAWVPFGVVASIWAFRRGWLGAASLLASPYWLPYYLQMVLLDLLPWRTERLPARRHTQNELASFLNLRRASGGATLWRLEVAGSWLGRLRGLMFRRSLESGAGLYLPGTNSVHMMFMRFPIDVVFLGAPRTDGAQPVIALRAGLRPWTGIVWWVRGARGAVEFAAGALAGSGIRVGDYIRLEPAEQPE